MYFSVARQHLDASPAFPDVKLQQLWFLESIQLTQFDIESFFSVWLGCRSMAQWFQVHGKCSNTAPGNRDIKKNKDGEKMILFLFLGDLLPQWSLKRGNCSMNVIWFEFGPKRKARFEFDAVGSEMQQFSWLAKV